MSWKRVTVFVGLLYCATFAAAFPFGFMVGIYIARGHPVPDWIPVGQLLAPLCAGTAVFFCLARYQSERVWRHAVAVLLIGWLLAFGINVVGLGVRARAWAMSLPLFVVPLVIGVSLGRMWRHHTDKAARGIPGNFPQSKAGIGYFKPLMADSLTGGKLFLPARFPGRWRSLTLT